MEFESVVVVALLICLVFQPRFSIIIVSAVSIIIFLLNGLPTIDGMEDRSEQTSITFYLLCILLVVLFLKQYI